MVGDKLTEECGLGSSSDHGEQSSINSGGDSTHLRDSTGEMASEEGGYNSHLKLMFPYFLENRGNEVPSSGL